MDPFEVRMQFLTLLRRLNASQQSIQKVVGYALKYYSRCGEDLWDCIVEECQKGSINSRINILYLLDSLCETCLLVKAQAGIASSQESENNALYVDYVSKDLGRIVEWVVPDGRQGLPNLMSTKQILESWRSKRILDSQKLEEALATLERRKEAVASESSEAADPRTAPANPLPRQEIFKRIEEDRERHKRLRERRWVQPISQTQSHLPPPLASFLPLSLKEVKEGNKDGDQGEGQAKDGKGGELTMDIEFENAWETTSDWNEDDDEAAGEENFLCFPAPLDLDEGQSMEVEMGMPMGIPS